MANSQLRSCRVAYRPFKRPGRHDYRPGQFSEDVKKRVNWEQFFTQELGPLNGAGIWRDARCPFHDDRHPSLRVNIKEGGYWCPVCSAHGDGIRLLMERDGVSFARALRMLEDGM